MKQLVGNVTKQVMAHHGYRLDQNNVKTPNGAPFTRASRYVRANEVTYRVFHDPANPRSLVLTKSKASPLPEWSYWKQVKGECGSVSGWVCPTCARRLRR